MKNVYSNRTYLQNLLWRLLLILQNLFIAESIFKIFSLNSFRNEPTFHYRYSLKFRGLDEFNFKLHIFS